MANDDLEIARQLLRGGWKPQRQRRAPRHDLVPAVFREIDGGELARQYATHRKIEEGAGRLKPARPNRFGSAKDLVLEAGPGPDRDGPLDNPPARHYRPLGPPVRPE